MTFWQDDYAGRTSLRRAELVDVDDSGEHQIATALGYDDERFSRIHRVQAFGLSANPPAGAHGLVGLVNGRLDQAVLLGIEHQQYRPRNVPPGATKLYDQDGTFVYLDAAGNLYAETRKQAQVKAGETAIVEAPAIQLKGNVTITGTLTVGGDVTVDGNIANTGDMTTDGVHTDGNGVHI